MYLFIYFYEEAAEDRDLEARRGASPMMTGQEMDLIPGPACHSDAQCNDQF